jgi:hypothetical protein
MMAYPKRKAFLAERPQDVDGDLWAWFLDEWGGSHPPADAYLAVPSPEALFRRHEVEIVRQWLASNPTGTRPPLWWDWCAPEPRSNESERAFLERHALLTAGE